MRTFLLRVLISTVVIAVILGLVPGITAYSPFVTNVQPTTVTTSSGATTTVDMGTCQSYDAATGQVIYDIYACQPIGLIGHLIVGFIFSVVVAFVQPAIVMFTGRLLISTMGLFLVLLNVILFIITLWVAPFAITVVGWPGLQGLITVSVAAILISVGNAVLTALLGVNVPRVTEDGTTRDFPWRIIEKLPFARTSFLVENIRLMQVYNTIWGYGLEILFGESAVFNVGRWVQHHVLKRNDPLAGLSTPAKVRLMLQELGPTYVKIGQIASSRSELLPPEWVTELSKLQSSARPFPYEEVRATIIEELGAPPEELFADFSKEPLAAASTAQVHIATLKTGEKVVVKVQRPRIVAMTEADLNIMRNLSRVFARRFKAAKNANVEGLLGEFADGVVRELDYRNEAYHMKRMAANMEGVPGVHVPILYSAFSSSKVLTMEFIDGVKLNKLDAIDAAGLDRLEIANHYVKALIKQLLFDGFFHGDPHPGNLVLNLQTGIITFLDLGLVGQLNERQRWALINLLWSLQSNDAAGLINVVKGLSAQTRPVNEAALHDDIDNVVQRYLIYGTGVEELGAVLSAITGTMNRYGMILDQQIALAIKAILQSEEFTRTLVPEMNLGTAAFQTVQQLFLEQVTPENVTKIIKDQAQKGVQEIFNRLPDLTTATWSWLDQYQKGKLSVTIETGDIEKEVARLRRAIAPFPAAVLLTGIVIGAAIGTAAMGAVANTQWEFLQPVMIAIFVFVIFFCLFMAWRLLRSLGSSD
jgi:ubiquinone biosynthesis protein